MESPWLSRLRRVCRLACGARPLPGSVFGLEGGCRTSPSPKRHARKAADGAQRVEVCWAASAPGEARRKPERNLGPESACGRESEEEEEEEREMGRKGEREDGQAAGGGDGWRPDWAFKREVNPVQRPSPGHLEGLGSWGSPGGDVGENGLNLVVLEGLRQAQGAQPCCCRSVGLSSGRMLRMLGERDVHHSTGWRGGPSPEGSRLGGCHSPILTGSHVGTHGENIPMVPGLATIWAAGPQPI